LTVDPGALPDCDPVLLLPVDVAVVVVVVCAKTAPIEEIAAMAAMARTAYAMIWFLLLPSFRLIIFDFSPPHDKVPLSGNIGFARTPHNQHRIPPQSVGDSAPELPPLPRRGPRVRTLYYTKGPSACGVQNLISACILIRTERGRMEELAKKLTQIPEIKRAFPVLGRYDIVADVEAADGKQLARAVTKTMRLGGIVFTETLPEVEA
jgi:DNA-binding Lrp family transcriptional regulator